MASFWRDGERGEHSRRDLRVASPLEGVGRPRLLRCDRWPQGRLVDEGGGGAGAPPLLHGRAAREHVVRNTTV